MAEVESQGKPAAVVTVPSGVQEGEGSATSLDELQVKW